MLIKIKVPLFLIMLFFTFIAKSQITFIVESLPGTTPEQDTIYIAGNFNGWSTNNVRYMLHQQVNGIYSITLAIDSGRFEYKFVRGSWATVETNEHNEYMPNRIYTPGDGNKVRVKIYNWQNLNQETKFSFILFYFISLSLFGFVLFFLVLRIKAKHRFTAQAFYLLNGLLLLCLLGAAVYHQSNPIWQLQIAMFAYVLLFLWGPSLEFALRAVRFQRVSVKHWQTYIPAMVILFVNILQLLNFPYIRFFSRPINPYLNLGNAIEILLGLTFILYFHLKARGFVLLNENKENSFEKENRLVGLVFFMSFIALLIFAVNFALLFIKISTTFLVDFQFVIVFLSFIIIIEMYFYWRYPDLLRDKTLIQIEKQVPFEIAPKLLVSIPANAVGDHQKERMSLVSIGNADQLLSQLTQLMLKKKPFKNPDLSIADLSDMIHSKPHIISRLINEFYTKNFRDFINEYRVNEFIALSVSDAYKNYTFLALAYEVGFNSKSTFNLAFKKVKGLSPSEYLKQNYNVIKDLDAGNEN